MSKWNEKRTPIFWPEIFLFFSVKTVHTLSVVVYLNLNLYILNAVIMLILCSGYAFRWKITYFDSFGFNFGWSAYVYTLFVDFPLSMNRIMDGCMFLAIIKPLLLQHHNPHANCIQSNPPAASDSKQSTNQHAKRMKIATNLKLYLKIVIDI